MALASLDLFDTERVIEGLAEKIQRLTDQLDNHMKCLRHVADIRQRGLMVGIELARDPGTRAAYAPDEGIGARVTVAARTHNVIVRPLGDVIVLMPPLSIRLNEIDSLVSAVSQAIVSVTET